MDLKVIFWLCFALLCFSLTAESKSVSKSDKKKEESSTSLKTKEDNDADSTTEDDYDCDPEKLKKCNIICEKNKTVEKRTCNCKEEEYKVECAQKRGVKCDAKKKCAKHSHDAAKRCKSTAGRKKSCCTKKKYPLMQRFFKFPAIMIAPIKSYNGQETGAMCKKGQKRCGCGCGCGCCCCEPCCCCCHECCCPCCCCCCEPCCCDCCHHCCDCCHHCCHCCHCPCCCGGCGGCGCKKSKAAPAKPPAIAPPHLG